MKRLALAAAAAVVLVGCGTATPRVSDDARITAWISHHSAELADESAQLTAALGGMGDAIDAGSLTLIRMYEGDIIDAADAIIETWQEAPESQVRDDILAAVGEDKLATDGITDDVLSGDDDSILRRGEHLTLGGKLLDKATDEIERLTDEATA